MKVVLVQNLPPNVTEEEIVAALEVYGALKSFGMAKNTGFADYSNPKHAENAINGDVIIRKWKAKLYFGNSVTKKPRNPKSPSHYDYMFAFDTHANLSKCQKVKVLDNNLSNVELFNVFENYYGNTLVCFNREYIWLFSIGDEREICIFCKFENIPNTRFCSGCGFDKWKLITNPK